MGRKEMMRKEEIEKLLTNVNKELRGIGLDPVQFFDDGWRICIDEFEVSLVFDAIDGNLEYVPSLELFLAQAFFDYDMEGGYYWVPYSQPPSGVTTPAMRLGALR